MTPKVIAFYSAAPASGKTEAAKRLVKYHGYTQVKFAGALKAMMLSMLLYGGSSQETAAAYIEGDMKNTPIDWAAGKSMRELMQTLGTEWGRSQVCYDMWVNITRDRILTLLGNGEKVVIDDMRFANEFDMVSELPVLTETVKIIRPKTEAAYKGKHGSEGMLEGMPFDTFLHNSANLHTFRVAVSNLLKCHISTPEKP